MEHRSGSFCWAPQLPRAILRCLHLLQPVSLSRERIGCLLKSIMSQHLYGQTVRGMWHTTEIVLNLLTTTDTSDRYFLFRNWTYYQAGDTLSKCVVLEPEEVVRFLWVLTTATLLPYGVVGREQPQRCGSRKSLPSG